MKQSTILRMGKLDSLPVELIEYIFGGLDVGTLCSLRATCRGFRSFVDDMKDMEGEFHVLSELPEQSSLTQSCYLVPGEDTFEGEDVPFTMDQLEDPDSGLLFWVSRLRGILVQGNDTHTDSFAKFFDRLLNFFEKHKIGGFEIRIEPYLRLGRAMDELVQRINQSTAEFSVDVTFADGYDPEFEDLEEGYLQSEPYIELGRKFQKVKFRLIDEFNPVNLFYFPEECDKLVHVIFTNLSRKGERLDTTPMYMVDLPTLFRAETVVLNELLLEGLRLYVADMLDGWERLEMDKFIMSGCLLFQDEDDEDQFEDLEELEGFIENQQVSRDGRFNLMHYDFKCMAKKVEIEQQLPDILQAFRFPRITELEVLNPPNPDYDPYPFYQHPDLKHVQLYLGPLDIEEPIFARFEYLSNVETLKLVHAKLADQVRDIVKSLVSVCPKLKRIEAIDWNELTSTTFCAPSWTEGVSQLLTYYPIRDNIQNHSHTNPFDLQFTVMEALEDALFHHDPWFFDDSDESEIYSFEGHYTGDSDDDNDIFP